MAKKGKGKGRGKQKKGKSKTEKLEAKKQREAQQEAESDPCKLPLWLRGGKSKNLDVVIENFRLPFPGSKADHLIAGSTLKLVNGHRYGLIGRNGDGKSSLLSYIAQGKVEGFPKHLRVLHLEQEYKMNEKPVLQYILSSDDSSKYFDEEEERLLELLENEEMDDHGDPNDLLQELYELKEDRSFHSAEARAKEILKGLLFTQEYMEKPTSRLSGGWRMRVRLAVALFIRPDILLLDEPTNHLDFPAVLWLKQYLSAYDKTLVVVSHDRDFLNDVSTDIIDLRDKDLTYYKGNYEQYLKTREELQINQQRLYDAQEKRIEEIKAFIEKFQKDESKAGLVSSRKKTLEKMEDLEPVKTVKEFAFNFPVPEKVDHDLIRIINMHFKHNEKDEKWLLKDINLNLDQTSRVGVFGCNGVGKSTLLNIISGDLQPNEGTAKLNDQVTVARFTQHFEAQLNLAMTPVKYLQDYFKGHNVKEQEARNHLGAFGLGGEHAMRKIGTLSGGQKARVAFAILTFLRPHLIVMDEPTNHLDIQTVDALIGAISRFQGGLLVVSHDVYFLKQVVKQYWAVNTTGEIKCFYDDIECAKKFSYTFPEEEEIELTPEEELKLKEERRLKLKASGQKQQQKAASANKKKKGK